MKIRFATIACGLIASSIVGANGANPNAEPHKAPQPAPNPAVAAPAAAPPAPKTSTPTPTTATASSSTTPSRDARVAFGDIRISRPRFGESQPAQIVGATGTISVPSNTVGAGESLQQRASREATDRRIAEAEALQREADAQFARVEASLAEDQIRRSTVLVAPFGTRFYTPAFRSARSRNHSQTVTVERFNSDAAIHGFAEAATPPIIRIQRDIDRAVIGNRLDRTTVNTVTTPAPPTDRPRPRR